MASAHCSSGAASFSYGVSDPNTGDIKDQHEKRDGGNVVGKYSLIESDGTKRVVEYSASDATGFNAVVHKEPTGLAGAVNTLGHAGLAHGALAAGSLAHGGLGVAAPAIHPATLPHTSIGAASLTHGAQNAVSYSNANILNSGLAHGSLNHGRILANGLAGNIAGGYANHAAPAVSQYSTTVVHGVRPYAGQYAGAYGIGAQPSLAHGASLGHGAALASRSLGYGYGNTLAGGLALNHGLAGNLAGVYAGRGTPAVSQYSHSIVHDVRPYAGQYAGAYRGYGAQLGALAHGGLASAAAGWASPLANAGWTSPLANGILGSPLAHGGLASPLALGGLGIGAPAPALAHGVHGANAAWRW